MKQIELEAEIKNYRKQINEAKQEVNRLEGSKRTLLKRLKEEFGYVSMEDAERKLVALKKERDVKYKSFEEKMREIQKVFSVV